MPDWTLLDPRNGPADDLPPQPGRVFVIASLPRTGSTLLGHLLESTGCAGVPREYLNPMQIRDWELRLGPSRWIRLRHLPLRGPLLPLAGRGPWDEHRLRDYLERVRARRTCGGWFGLKLHHHHLEQWFLDRGWSMDELLAPARWITITREDRLAQAISWARAAQTGRWAEWQRGWAPPVYSRRLIQGRLDAIEAGERGWEAWFQAHGTQPHRLTYEALVSDPVAATRGVLAHLGAPEGLPIAPSPTRPQRDPESASWRTRFLAEGGR